MEVGMIVICDGHEYELMPSGNGWYGVYDDNPKHHYQFNTSADQCNCSGKFTRNVCGHIVAVRQYEDNGPQE